MASELRRKLGERQFYRREKKRVSALRLLLAKGEAGARRRRAYLDLLRYQVTERSALPIYASKRARFIVGNGARRDYWDAANSVLMLDEGPVGSLVAVGGFGHRWDGWEGILLPDPGPVEPWYVFLDAPLATVEQRVRKRARPHRDRFGRTGKEGTSVADRAVGLAFWYGRLIRAGGQCLWVDTEARSAGEIADEIVDRIRGGRPDRSDGIPERGAGEPN